MPSVLAQKSHALFLYPRAYFHSTTETAQKLILVRDTYDLYLTLKCSSFQCLPIHTLPIFFWFLSRTCRLQHNRWINSPGTCKAHNSTTHLRISLKKPGKYLHSYYLTPPSHHLTASPKQQPAFLSISSLKFSFKASSLTLFHLPLRRPQHGS